MNVQFFNFQNKKSIHFLPYFKKITKISIKDIIVYEFCVTACKASAAIYTLVALVTGCTCIYSRFYRSRMGKQYMLSGDPCADCLVHFCCENCALCQEYRELKNRGFDMSLGNKLPFSLQNLSKNIVLLRVCFCF